MNNGGNNNNSIISGNKGRGLFYGVIAIATFIIMGVGATFAYFTATTNSTDTALQTGSTTLELTYINYGSAWSKKDLIPADEAVVEYSVEYQSDTTTTSGTTGSVETGDLAYVKDGNNTICKDDDGNSICSLYVFQITNSAKSSQLVSINVVSTLNQFKNLHAMAYEISLPEDTTDYDSKENGNGINDPAFRFDPEKEYTNEIQVTDGYGTSTYSFTPIYINRNGVTKTLLRYNKEVDGVMNRYASTNVPLELSTGGSAKIADNVEIEGGETATFALVLYILNKDYDQTTEDAEKTFDGQVIVKSGDGSGGVSGTIGRLESGDFVLQSKQPETPEEDPTDEPTDEPGTGA